MQPEKNVSTPFHGNWRDGINGTGTVAEKAAINHPPFVEKSLVGKEAEENLARHLAALESGPRSRSAAT